mmetsp:Transcript_21465/g.40223  ORF Transcript_21465/g.40223 Transcript_21465/m.40223 type:complete len:82 (+) Transcript_21465:475-720(+)
MKDSKHDSIDEASRKLRRSQLTVERGPEGMPRDDIHLFYSLRVQRMGYEGLNKRGSLTKSAVSGKGAKADRPQVEHVIKGR